jgi:hypothetical protein
MQCNNINNKKDGNKIARIVHLVFRILRNLPYDIIIGRPDITKYNLWYLLGSKQGDHEENINHKIIYDPPPKYCNGAGKYSSKRTRGKIS